MNLNRLYFVLENKVVSSIQCEEANDFFRIPEIILKALLEFETYNKVKNIEYPEEYFDSFCINGYKVPFSAFNEWGNKFISKKLLLEQITNIHINDWKEYEANPKFIKYEKLSKKESLLKEKFLIMFNYE